METTYHKYAYWQNRLVVVHPDGTWAMSRVGAPYDFNFAADHEDAQRAVAGRCCVEINPEPGVRDCDCTISLCPIDDYRLILVQKSGHVFVVVGDVGIDWRISLVKDMP